MCWMSERVQFPCHLVHRFRVVCFWNITFILSLKHCWKTKNWSFWEISALAGWHIGILSLLSVHFCSSCWLIGRQHMCSFIVIPPSKKRGYIGVTVSVCLSVGRSAGSHILSGLFLTNHWVVFNKILHEASIPRGDVHILNGFQLHIILQSYGSFTY